MSGTQNKSKSVLRRKEGSYSISEAKENSCYFFSKENNYFNDKQQSIKHQSEQLGYVTWHCFLLVSLRYFFHIRMMVVLPQAFVCSIYWCIHFTLWLFRLLCNDYVWFQRIRFLVCLRYKKGYDSYICGNEHNYIHFNIYFRWYRWANKTLMKNYLIINFSNKDKTSWPTNNCVTK